MSNLHDEGTISDFISDIEDLIEKYVEVGPGITIAEMVGVLETEKAKLIARWLENGPYSKDQEAS